MIVFLSNYLSHHQLPFCEEMYKITNGEFMFIGTQEIKEERGALGWKQHERPYVLKSYTDDNSYEQCVKFINDADLVIYGSAPEEMLQKRLKANKLTVRYSERLYKERFQWYKYFFRLFTFYKRWGRHKSLYLLCASAYAAADYALTGTFLKKAYKWGYFPELQKYDIKELFQKKEQNSKITFLWAGRFIVYKHVEIAIELAEQLKEDGYDFEMNLIGGGELEDHIKNMIDKKDLSDRVFVLGAMSPENVRKNMEQADIFLFTSDRNEGWGAVLNEAMNSGCAVIARQSIGSAPFLIKNRENGFFFKSRKEIVVYAKELLENKDLRKNVGQEAYKTIAEDWNSKVASERLLKLFEDLKEKGFSDTFADGPCSRADVIHNWHLK